MQEIIRKIQKYCIQSVLIVVLLSCLLLAVGSRLFDDFTIAAMIVCVAFSVFVELAYVMIWVKVRKSAPDMLTSFYTAASGFRMLLALATMGIYYVATDDGMLTFLIIFAIYYFLMLAHNTFFFARLTNSDNNK